MRSRLLVKLLAAMGAVVLLGGLTSSLIIGVTTKKAFRTLVRENDVNLSRNFAGFFEEYYLRNGSWNEVGEYLTEPGSLLFPGRRRGMQGEGPAGPMGSGGHMPMMDQRAEAPPVRMVLTDADGRVATHTLEDFSRSRINESLLEEGTPLYVSGKTVGFLFIGSMVDPVFGPFQQNFLRNVYRSIFISTILVAAVALLIAALVFRNIVGPLEKLTEATRLMGKGSYDIDLDLGRSDEIGELSRSFQQMAESIRKTDELKRRLISDSAHELRTPVSILQGNLEMMRDGVYPADGEHLDRLYDETLLLSRLVAELRTLSELDEGSLQYAFAEVGIEELLRRIIANYRAEASAKKVELILQIHRNAAGSRIHADRHKLEQAISNVVSNALRYSPEGGKVQIEVERDDAATALSVEDSGDGIATEEREKVFERFYRTDRARNRESGGTGLGLSIAREIVKDHGGVIRAVDPRELGGARFSIFLPLTE